jgi:UDP-N-acetylmuramoyl-L-alanyl-D-glutamate--2,6-diaminopimelate ligase
LERLASVVPGASLRRGGDDALITDVAFDHRSVTPGALFFAVPGERADGHEHAAEAVAAGAVAVVVERWLDLGAPQVRVASVREAMGPMSSMAFGEPSSSMATVGITGTNGKTTVTYVLESIFEAARWKAGVIGTTGARLDGEPLPLSHTTPEAPDLQRVLALMRDRDVRAVAMEASSHALAQHRTDGVVFDVAVFTNLSQDHLDYHASMEAYFAAKARLFTPAHARHGAVNVDDPAGRRLRESEIPITTYAVDNPADLRASDVRATAEGLSFVLGGVVFRSALRGAFNVANIAGAVVAARDLGVPDSAIVDGVAALRAVPGRMEPVDAGQDFLVVVDYAHTPDSIRSVLRAARPLTSGRLILVFGCGGDRDRLKRPAMAAAATQGADLTVLTTDNPRSEDPLAIIAEVQRGAVDGGGEHVVEPDRRSAIRAALHEARAGDVVVIAGKGHETVQEFSDRTIPFDDRTVAREELVSLGSSA